MGALEVWVVLVWGFELNFNDELWGGVEIFFRGFSHEKLKIYSRSRVAQWREGVWMAVGGEFRVPAEVKELSGSVEFVGRDGVGECGCESSSPGESEE